MPLEERVFAALKASSQFPLYFALYYAYSFTDENQRPKESLDERLLSISEDVIMEVATEDELETVDYDEICCYCRACCFDMFQTYRNSLT